MSEDIKAKIRKLLTLSENAGATEHEAQRALEMAQALMLKYNVSVEPESDEAEVIEGTPFRVGKYDEMWHRMLAGAACYLYTAKSIVWTDYDPKTRRDIKGFKFVGRAESIDAVQVTLDYMVAQVEQLYKTNLPPGLSKTERSDFRRSFKFSCATRVMTRCRQMMESVKKSDAKAIEYTGSKALVVVETIERQLKDIEDFCSTKMKLQSLPAVRARKIGSGYAAGKVAGDQVKIHKEIGG